MKYLVLIIYNETVEYEKSIYLLHTNYLNKLNDFVTYYFIVFRENLQEDIVIDGNILYMKGTESIVPGIMEKTMIAIKYLYEKIEFDMFIRTNISTVINYNLLNKFLIKRNGLHDYFGFNTGYINYVDLGYGVTKEHHDTRYITGTNIFLTKTGLTFLIDHEHELDYSVVDDVAIGYLFKQYNIYPHVVNDCLYKMNNMEKTNIFFRNKRNNRDDDVNAIKYIYDNIVL